MADHDAQLDPDAFLGYTLARVAHVIEQRIERRLRDRIGLSVRQFGALAHLSRDPGIGSGQLARLLLITPQSAGPLVDTLAAMGLVSRGPGVKAGTRRPVGLTQAGRAALAQGYAVAGQANDEDFAALSPDQRTAMNSTLQAVLASLATGPARPT